MPLPERIALVIEGLSEWTGRAVSWLTTLLVILFCYDVLMRYFFQSTSIAMVELEWHLFGLIFILGAAFAFKHDKHVRVDVFYARFSPKRKAWVNLIGTLVFLLPFCLVILNTSASFFMNAYQIRESSPDPGGLPARYLIKGSIFVGFALLFLQGLAEIIRSVQTLTTASQTAHAE